MVVNDPTFYVSLFYFFATWYCTRQQMVGLPLLKQILRFPYLMRRAGNGDDPFSGTRTGLVDRDARTRVATDLADPSAAFADNRTGQLEI